MLIMNKEILKSLNFKKEKEKEAFFSFLLFSLYFGKLIVKNNGSIYINSFYSEKNPESPLVIFSRLVRNVIIC